MVFLPKSTISQYIFNHIGLDRYGREELPNSESYFHKTMSLPLHVAMSVTDVEYVVENLINAARV